jgi:hypothetical protein
MESINFLTPLSTPEGIEPTRIDYLEKIARGWDGSIRHELRQFAQYLWPDARVLGLVPIHSYRFRKQLESGTIVWWVERDIPPFDRYRCEAYRVELSIAGQDQVRLLVRSGISAYPVVPASMEGLKIALVRAGATHP